MALRTDRTLYLDLEVDFGRGGLSTGSTTDDTSHVPDALALAAAAQPESADLWYRRAAHYHGGVLRATAKSQKLGWCSRDKITPVSDGASSASSKRAHNGHIPRRLFMIRSNRANGSIRIRLGQCNLSLKGDSAL